MDQAGLRQIFEDESNELVADLEQGLVTLEGDPTDVNAINQIFRSAHTLKSTAAMVGIDPNVQFTHLTENVLARAWDHELAIDQTLISLLLRAVDTLRQLLDQAAAGVPVALDVVGLGIFDALQAYRANERLPEVRTLNATPLPAGSLRFLQIDMAFRSDFFSTGQDPACLIYELADIGEVLEVRANLDALPSFLALDPHSCYVSWSLLLRTVRPLSDVEAVFLFVADHHRICISDKTTSNRHLAEVAEKKLGELLVDEGCLEAGDLARALLRQKRIGEVLIDLGAVKPETVARAVGRQKAARKIHGKATIRVDTVKLDRLVNLAGELAIVVSQVNQAARDPHSAAATRLAVAESLDQISRELQAQIMSVRMVPIEETFSRFRRAVRDLAQELGKHVVLETLGSETELDKIESEQLADPLKHMVRNAIAHGLETPAERIARGKSDTGRILLTAVQRQGHIVIAVQDDGRGIDPELVLAKGRQLGLVSPLEHPDERQIFDLLFRPGFSTASEVNEVSGRGVGLDVVRKNVADLQGSIKVESVPGVGTTFRIKLPLTLALIEGMNVRSGKNTLTIPLSSVVELISTQTDQIATLEGKGELVDVRGEYLPMVRLSDTLDSSEANESNPNDVVIEIVEGEGRRFGLMVDLVLGMEQTIVRPLRSAFSVVSAMGMHYRKPDAVSGATILGNGNVALILDVPGLERMAFGGALS